MFKVTNTSPSADLICLSHLRWNFVFQRPQHLMTRCAAERRVFFVEEPLTSASESAHLEVQTSGPVRVVVPHLPEGLSPDEIESAQRLLIDELIRAENIAEYILWYYTPMALAFTSHLSPAAVVYDCMDELSAFRAAPLVLRTREAELMRRADLVLTGGQSLYEAKRHLHPNIHPFPSSVDVAHFAQARRLLIRKAAGQPECCARRTRRSPAGRIPAGSRRSWGTGRRKQRPGSTTPRRRVAPSGTPPPAPAAGARCG